MDTEQTSLTDLVNGDEAPDVVEHQEETRERDEHGRFAKKGEDEGAPPAPAKESAFDGPATLDERRKRQEAEQRATLLEQELQALRNPPAPPPSIWEDEQGAFNHFGGQVIQTAVQQASLNANLNMSEMLARRDHEDFDDLKSDFLALVQQNPELRQQALADPHPWQKAYQIAKTHRTMKDLGATDVDGLREQIRQELLAEIGGQPRAGAPPTISTERSTGSRAGPAWSGPTSLSDMLK